MATKKSKSSKVQKHQPTQRSVRLAEESASIAGGRVVFANEVASRANRRLYRQSRVYSLKVDVDIGSVEASAGVDVYILRDTWDLHGAYKLAMKNYYNAMKEELMASNGSQTRWHDFRVVSDFQADKMCGSMSRPNTATATMDSFRLNQGDVLPSQVIDSNGNAYEFTLGIATGGSPNQYSIGAEWNKFDITDDDPQATATSMPYSGIVNDADEANYDLLRVRGEEPPYSSTANTSLWTKVCTLQETATGGQKLSSGYFDAPLGLVILVSSAFTSGGAPREITPLTLSYQKGNYKGVHAPAYATPILTEDKMYEVV